MSDEKDDIQEISQAVEKLGEMVEESLARVNQKLGNLDEFLGSQEKGIKQELYEIKEEMGEINEFLENYDARISRIEIKLSELFKGKEGALPDFEKFFDLKMLLTSLKEDIKEFLGHEEYVDRKLKDFEGRMDDLEKGGEED